MERYIYEIQRTIYRKYKTICGFSSDNFSIVKVIVKTANKQMNKTNSKGI